MAETSIEWTDKVWNPVTGCTKVSQGCKNCYAEVIADRFFAKQYPPNADGSLRVFTDVRWHEDRLYQPLHWRKPSRIFVNSMSDLFHEDVPFEFVERVWNICNAARQHTFQILTKRPERAIEFAKWFSEDVGDIDGAWSENVWLGVSVEDQKTADERIPLLLQTPAAVRWVSYEPALGPVDFTPYLNCTCPGSGEHCAVCLSGGLNWLVCGGESGPGARPMHPDWARSVRDQCKAAGVPFFFKQWGEWQPFGHVHGGPVVVSNDSKGRYSAAWAGDYETKRVRIANSDGDCGVSWVCVGKKAAGRLLDGVEHSEYPHGESK